MAVLFANGFAATDSQMDLKIMPLSERDFPALVEFLNRCFQVPQHEGFETALPSLFIDRSRCAACNYAIRDDEKFLGVAGIYPINWSVGNTILRTGGIGNVAVDPENRGNGIMSQLMQHVVKIMPAMGFDLSWLGGKRRRYSHFGYEKAGVLQEFVVAPDNFTGTKMDDPRLSTRRFVFDSDARWLPQLIALHDSQAIHCVRGDERFSLHLQNRKRVTWFTLDSDSMVQAYAVTSEDFALVTECVATDEVAAKALISSIITAAGQKEVQFQCSTQNRQLGQLLNRTAEHIHLTTNGNWLIFDWPRVIGALLRAHHRHSPLPYGAVTIGVGGSSLLLSIRPDCVRCDWSDEAPDLVADTMTLTRLLFGPAKPSEVVDLKSNASILQAWCPLPAGFSPQDYV